jgi:alkylated DNA repair protein alkB family protein 7
LAPHILELREGNSGIGPHVDNLVASGDVIAAMCLISPAVMMFKRVSETPTDEAKGAVGDEQKDGKESYFTALLPAGCLYYQRGEVRYKFTHSIPLNPEEHVFKGEKVVRGRRISIMVRSPVRI